MIINQLKNIDLNCIIKIRPPENHLKMNSLTSQKFKTTRYHHKTPLNIYFLSTLIWMIILLSQSTKANSVFLESCSSSNINQVFCHNDQLYVIQDNVLYYGNSCGQMMTNETIRVNKKFKTTVAMKTAFIDDKNSIFLFSNNFVLTSHLDNRHVAELNNISQVILDYYGTVKYTVFEPNLKHVYVVDKDDKMHIFNSKIFSHIGSIKWGKDQSNLNTVDLKGFPFDFFFFAGPDLFAKLKGQDSYTRMKNFGYCLSKVASISRLPDFEHCLNTYISAAYTTPLKVLVCTEIQYLIWVILLLILLIILLCCCISCCYGYFTDKEKGGKSYYVKDNEDRFLKKLFKKYPKDKFNHFVNLYKKNELNPVKLDPDSVKTKSQLDLEFGKNHLNGYSNEAHYPTEIKYPPTTNAPMEIKSKDVIDIRNNLRSTLPKEHPIKHETRQMQSNDYMSTRIPININDKIVYADANSNYERTSLILEDYAENKPDIDLKEPKPYSNDFKRPPPPRQLKYQSPYKPKSVEEPYILNQHIKPFQYDNSQFNSALKPQSTPQLPYVSSTYNKEVEITNSSAYQHTSFSVSKFVPKILNLFSTTDQSKSGKDLKTKF